MSDIEIMWFLELALKISLAILIGLHLYINFLDKKIRLQEQILLDIKNKENNKKENK